MPPAKERHLLPLGQRLWRVARVLLVLFALVVVAGHFMSPEFQGAATIDLQSSPEAVWGAINDFQKLPVSDRFCKGVDVIDGTRPTWREHVGGSSLVIDTLESSAPNLLVRNVRDEKVPMTMRNEYRIRKMSTGSELTLASKGEIRNGTLHVPFFRLIMRLTDAPNSNARHYLNSVAGVLSEKAEAQ